VTHLTDVNFWEKTSKSVLALVVLGGYPAAADWTMYLADAAHSSYLPAETALNPSNLSQLQQLWRTNVGAPIASGATASNGTLYFGAWDGNLYSVNGATGDVLWKVFLGVAPAPTEADCQPSIGVTAQPVVDGDVVYAGGGDSAVYALDRSTGTILWRTPLADPQSGAYLWSSLLLENGAIYIGIASLGDCPLVRGGVARISLNDPSHPLVRYLVPDGALGASVWSTPAIDEKGNILYVTTGNADAQDAASGNWGSALLALDATTLAIRAWFFKPIADFDPDSDWGSSPTLFQTADGHQYVAANGKDGVMYVLNRADLSLAWTYKLATLGDDPEEGQGSLSTPAFDEQTLYAGAGTSDAANSSPGSVYAIDPATHNARWFYGARGVVLAPVTVTPYLVLVPSSKGLAVLDAATGVEAWNDQGSVGLFGQAVMINGTIVATYVNGDVAAWTLPDLDGVEGTLAASPGTLKFGYTSGGSAPPAQSVNIFSNADSVAFTFSSDSSWLSAATQGVLTPAGVTIQADPTGLAPGSYTGSVTATSADGSTSATINCTLEVSGLPPLLITANVLSAATFLPAAPAPGGLFTMMAADLSASINLANTPDLPTLLDGVSVTINGIPAPLIYVSPMQINAQVPFEVGPGPATLALIKNGVPGQSVPISIADAAPQIFLTTGTHAAALNQNFSVNSPSNPATTGSVLSIFWTGQGQVGNPVTTGAPASALFLNTTVASTTATIGGQPATVLYSGLAPGFVGLAQANLQVPDLPSGEYPVVIMLGSATSNNATVSIRRQ
jgi:uncharacterized protein (TIGR03437 family)